MALLMCKVRELHLLVADGVAHAAGAGAGHPGLRGKPLALQLGGVRGDHSLRHQHRGQVGVCCGPDDRVTLQKGKIKRGTGSTVCS